VIFDSNLNNFIYYLYQDALRILQLPDPLHRPVERGLVPSLPPAFLGTKLPADDPRHRRHVHRRGRHLRRLLSAVGLAARQMALALDRSLRRQRLRHHRLLPPRAVAPSALHP